MNMMTKSLLTAGIIATTMGTAQADTIYGLYADANYWNTEVESSYNGVDADYDDQGQMMASVSVEHFVPLVPNVRVRHATLDADGTLGTVKSELDLSSTDAIAYYEILDNVVSADIGLGAKFLQGDFTRGTTTTNLDETLPMGYASVGAKLPFTGLSAKAELGIAKGTDVDVTDAQAEIKYDFVDTLAMDLGAKVGYRVMEIDYDDVKDKELNTDFKGPYVGLELHF